MSSCPVCNAEMDYSGEYNKWYCKYCRQYHRAPSPRPLPPQAQAPLQEPGGSRAVMLAAVILAVIIILSAILYAASVAPDSSHDNDGTDTTEADNTYYNEVSMFPTIEITLRHKPDDGDILYIKHIKGDPLDWTRYKIIITGNDVIGNITYAITAVMKAIWSFDLMNAGDTISINETNTEGFSDIDYKKGNSYQLEIYNLKENIRVYYRDKILCE